MLLLSGCMGARAPMLKALAIENTPVPEGGNVTELKVRPILRPFPFTQYILRRGEAITRVRVMGSPEQVLSFYRAELTKRGWREDDDVQRPAAKGDEVFFVRGNEMRYGWHEQEVRLRLNARSDESVVEVQIVIEASFSIDEPGDALARQNAKCSEGPAFLFHSDAAGAIAAWPEAFVISMFF